MIKTAYSLLFFFSACFLTSCVVPLKKYNATVKLKDSLQVVQSIVTNENSKLSNANTDLVNENSILRLKISNLNIAIENMGKITPDPHILVIPNPPPPSTDYEIFRGVLRTSKTYSDANEILKAAFEKNRLKMLYLAFQDEGYIVCTPIEEIDYKGNRVKDEIAAPEGLLSFVSHLFSRQHIDELLFSKTGHYRWVVFIISSDVNNLHGHAVDDKILQEWVDSKQVEFPFEKLSNPMPKNTYVYALLYEFEQNENVQRLIPSKDSPITKFEKLPIIKTLTLLNYEKR